jgi:hypothetical protein
MFQSQLKKNAEVWTKKYMPAFRSSDYNKRIWAMPQQHKVNGTKVGKILERLRDGRSHIPQIVLLEMEAMGYNGGKSAYESRWQKEYLPAFKASSYGKQKRLWAIPTNAIVNSIKIGRVIDSTRTGHSSIPEMHLLEMEAMGYNGGKSAHESRWQKEYIPAFKASSYGLEGRIHAMPKKYVFNEIKIGQLLSNIKKGNTPIPEPHMVEMKALGYIRNELKRKRE